MVLVDRSSDHRLALSHSQTLTTAPCGPTGVNRMAFGTWPAAAVVPAANINTAHGIPSSIDADGRMILTGHVALEEYFSLQFSGTLLQAPADQAALDDNTGSATCTGVLVSAAPGANQHGIPANFGPGRGLWTPGRLSRLRYHVICTGTRSFEAAAPLHSWPQVQVVLLTQAGGNITMVFKNFGALQATTINIWLQYLHSVVL